MTTNLTAPGAPADQLVTKLSPGSVADTVTRLSQIIDAQGLKLFEEHAPDLVVTDIRMPVMGGIEMARLMLARNHELPVIITSAHSDVAYLTESIEIGISRYLIKPVETDKLFTAVEECLSALSLQKELKAQELSLIHI